MPRSAGRAGRARPRARSRTREVSDAGPAQAEAQTREWEPLAAGSRVVVATDRAPGAVLAALAIALERRLHRGA